MECTSERYGIVVRVGPAKPPTPVIEHVERKDVHEFKNARELARELRDKCVTMIVGYGDKMGYKDKDKLRETVETCVRGTTLLYFGDTVDYGNPTVGLAFLYAAANLGADVYMVQITGAQSYPIPSFVRGVYWHNSWEEGPYKWGGTKDTPLGIQTYSNTSVWYKLFDAGIEFKAYALGGGPIAQQEVQLMKKLGIPVAEIPMEPARSQ